MATPLKQYGLIDGDHVVIKHKLHKNPCYGVVVDSNKIQCGGGVLNLVEFGKYAGWAQGSMTPSGAAQRVFLKSDNSGTPDKSLADLKKEVDSGVDRPARGDAAIEALLKKAGVAHAADLRAFFTKRNPKCGFAFRVCRFDENPAQDGLRVVQTCLRKQKAQTTPLTYFKGMITHVQAGSRMTTRRPFISATRSLEQALWWSYGGVFKVVAVDLDALKEDLQADVLFWDVGEQDAELTYGFSRNTAMASEEVVFDNNVPLSACTVLDIKWEPVGSMPRMVCACDAGAEDEFPSCDDIEHPSAATDVQVLNGSTQPLKVTIGGKTYVMKRGGMRQLDAMHSSSEFLALNIYSLAGAPVPPAAMYHVLLGISNLPASVPDPLVHMCVLLTKFIQGKPFLSVLNAGGPAEKEALKAQVREFAAMDVAVANFDVAGPDYSNLIVEGSTHKVYRIDVGGSMLFTPDGQKKNVLKFFANDRESVRCAASAMTNDSATSVNFSSAGQTAAGSGMRQPNFTIQALDANKALFGDVLSLSDLAAQARAVLGTQGLDVALGRYLRNIMDTSWVSVCNTVRQRLRLLATETAAA